MDNNLIFCGGSTEACRFACTYLQEYGWTITDQPSESVRYLLLDVPSFNSEGLLRGGGNVETILSHLPPDVIVCGGNLKHPALETYRTVDFLQDKTYLAENAYITAECALDVALPYLTVTLRNCPVLIIGWGRIGKCLGTLLKAIGANVTIAARKESDRAMIRALGYHAEDSLHPRADLRQYRLIFNTVPAPVLDTVQTASCRPDCIKIELASKNGIAGEDVITARGLPGIHMPESSGLLIANRFVEHVKKEDTL